MIDTKHWRDQAKELRALADGASSPERKQVILDLAERCDRLVERAEGQTEGLTNKLPSQAYPDLSRRGP
jgi:hypothetical protein